MRPWEPPSASPGQGSDGGWGWLAWLRVPWEPPVHESKVKLEPASSS